MVQASGLHSEEVEKISKLQTRVGNPRYLPAGMSALPNGRG
jgi:hypothetical protein